MKKFIKSLIDENPLLVLCLGMCPALAVTTTFENGYLMGLSVLTVLVFSNFIISLISRFIDEQIRIPAYIMIIATFVTILDILMQNYMEPLSRTLGIYIPLIIVNCIVLGRALSYASKNKVGASIIDAFKMGIGYTLALSLIGLIRELLGNNTITIMDKISGLTGYISKYEIFPSNAIIPNPLFLTPAGAFLTLGLILGIINALRKDDNK
ncbi:MAG: electron transport complex subunit RsxE [Bacilli bacterium]|jgi:electron transport complex protein RnfE